MVIAFKCSLTVLSNGAMGVLKAVLLHNLNDSLPLLVRNLNTLFDRSTKLNLQSVEELSFRNPQFLVQQNWKIRMLNPQYYLFHCCILTRFSCYGLIGRMETEYKFLLFCFPHSSANTCFLLLLASTKLISKLLWTLFYIATFLKNIFAFKKWNVYVEIIK